MCRTRMRLAKRSSPSTLDTTPASSRPLEAQISVRMSESGGRAVERKLTLPVASDSAILGVKPIFSGRSLADGANADFDVIMLSPDGKSLAKNGVRYDLLKVESSYQWYRQNGQWEFEPVKRTERVASGTVDIDRRQAGASVSSRQMGALSSGSFDGRSEWSCNVAQLRCRISMRRRMPTRRIFWKLRSTNPTTSPARR